MSPSYRKRLMEKRKERSRKGVEARAICPGAASGPDPKITLAPGTAEW